MLNLEDAQKHFWVQIPDSREFRSQSDEYFTVRYEGKEQILKLHNYAEIYQIPGLYQYVLVDILGDRSPDTLSSLLIDHVAQSGASVTDLRVLDMGAGIGLSGRSLRHKDVNYIVGLDILLEAREASVRELPGIYLDYYVADLLKLSESTKTALINHHFNSLMCCSALTCHVPIQAFVEAFNLIADDGWIGFNVNQFKLDPAYNENDEFFKLFQRITQSGAFQVACVHDYEHRHSMSGNPIYYCAVIGQKRHSVL